MRRALQSDVRHRELPNNISNVLDASVAIRSKISLTKELRIAIALLEIPVSGCTCFNTEYLSQLVKPISARRV
jgi:hypothetical protein